MRTTTIDRRAKVVGPLLPCHHRAVAAHWLVHAISPAYTPLISCLTSGRYMHAYVVMKGMRRTTTSDKTAEVTSMSAKSHACSSIPHKKAHK